jgi:spore coat-associated protein N
LKKILGVLMAVGLALGAVGTSFAFFEDTETSTGNMFTAGTLDLDNTVTVESNCPGKVTINEGANGLNDNVVFANLAPGDSGKIIWTLENVGTIDGILDVLYQGVNDYDGVNTQPEITIEGIDITATTPGELNDNMTLDTAYFLNNVQQSYTWHGNMSICTATLTHANSFPEPLPAGSIYRMEWSWSIPSGVGNIIQGDTFELNFFMSLTQQ